MLVSVKMYCGSVTDVGILFCSLQQVLRELLAE